MQGGGHRREAGPVVVGWPGDEVVADTKEAVYLRLALSRTGKHPAARDRLDVGASQAGGEQHAETVAPEVLVPQQLMEDMRLCDVCLPLKG